MKKRTILAGCAIPFIGYLCVKDQKWCIEMKRHAILLGDKGYDKASSFIAKPEVQEKLATTTNIAKEVLNSSAVWASDTINSLSFWQKAGIACVAYYIAVAGACKALKTKDPFLKPFTLPFDCITGVCQIMSSALDAGTNSAKFGVKLGILVFALGKTVKDFSAPYVEKGYQITKVVATKAKPHIKAAFQTAMQKFQAETSNNPKTTKTLS